VEPVAAPRPSGTVRTGKNTNPHSESTPNQNRAQWLSKSYIWSQILDHQSDRDRRAENWRLEPRTCLKWIRHSARFRKQNVGSDGTRWLISTMCLHHEPYPSISSRAACFSFSPRSPLRRHLRRAVVNQQGLPLKSYSRICPWSLQPRPFSEPKSRGGRQRHPDRTVHL
jgi:hypothetical protein